MWPATSYSEIAPFSYRMWHGMTFCHRQVQRISHQSDEKATRIGGLACHFSRWSQPIDDDRGNLWDIIDLHHGSSLVYTGTVVWIEYQRQKRHQSRGKSDKYSQTLPKHGQPEVKVFFVFSRWVSTLKCRSLEPRMPCWMLDDLCQQKKSSSALPSMIDCVLPVFRIL